MPGYKDKKLLYHLTKLTNIPSILDNGLLPRAQLKKFDDVADQEIIRNRQALKLENYVPFHWFAGNPFDGRVKKDHKDSYFALISVRRALAEKEDWVVIPYHPLANRNPELLSYKNGVDRINWATMDRRNYHDAQRKSVCMAECLAPRVVHVRDFFRIYAPDERVAGWIRKHLAERRIPLEVDVNCGMFC